MFYHKDLRTLIIWWNNTFPYDKWWRDKYRVAFNSPKHRRTSQIDIYLEYLEDEIFEEDRQQHLIQQKEEEDFKKGEIIKSRTLPEENIDLEDIELDFSHVNSKE